MNRIVRETGRSEGRDAHHAPYGMTLSDGGTDDGTDEDGICNAEDESATYPSDLSWRLR